MDEIMIPKKWLGAILVIVGLGTGILAVGPKVLGRSQAAESPLPQQLSTPAQQPRQDDSGSQKAAVAGAQAFYSVDYRKGQQAWLNQLCTVSTQTGCVVYQNVIGPNLWPAFEQAQTITSVKVTAQEMLEERIADSRDNAPMHIWRLQIELSDPWPVQREPQTVFSALSLVIKESGEWKFERFLTEEELSSFPSNGGNQ